MREKMGKLQNVNIQLKTITNCQKGDIPIWVSLFIVFCDDKIKVILYYYIFVLIYRLLPG